MGRGTRQGSIPVDFVQEFPMLGAQGSVLEEACGKMLQDLMHNFPVRGAEIRAKGLATGEKKFVGDDV